ncbi:MAG TPA: metallophosphoesterase family protein [Candidatus Polarisedimenticolia bacterium]|jgi:putative phosphoesterase|nr:metallophosphoesterase family protein [Candidatus Polarisedimenticolia bacterium]
MKLIVLGDIHGNLPALEKCVAEARKEGFDRLLHSGDLVGYGPDTDEVIQLLRRARIDGVRGNWDEAVAWDLESTGSHHPDGRLAEAAAVSYADTCEKTSRIGKSILGNLPFEIRFRESGMTFSLVHANPVDCTTYLFEDSDELTFAEYAKASEADVLLFGHTHQHFHRQVRTRHFISVGSVGVPPEDDPRTGYTVLYTGNIGKGIDVNFRRFEFDTSRLAQRYREKGMRDPFPRPLLTRTA